MPSFEERRVIKKARMQTTASPTPSPTFTPTDPDRRPILIIWETNVSFYGDMIGDYDKASQLCRSLSDQPNSPLVFPMLGYTDRQLVDAAQAYDKIGIPIYYNGEPMAMKWSSFLTFWTTIHFLDGLTQPIWTGFSSDYGLEANCGNWQDRFREGMLSDEAVVPCGEKKHPFMCVRVSYI